MLDQRRRRWTDVVEKLYKCFVVTGIKQKIQFLKNRLLPMNAYIENLGVAQSQNAVSAYLTSDEILPFGFAV